MRVPRLLSAVAALAATALAVGGLGFASAPSAHAFINQPKPLSQVFNLHSSSGSRVKIYLDFLTTNTSGSQYGDPSSAKSALYLPDATYTGLDFDGNPSTFNTAERRAILTAWQTAAEDYAPFNVDVTTQAPTADQLALTSTSDASFGVKIFISSDARVTRALQAKKFSGITWIQSMAYLGAPGSQGFGFRSPATLISTTLLQNNANLIGQVVSHEAGHAAGLTHDGQRQADGSVNPYYPGNGLAGAIMGSAYTDPISVFNDGDYPGAVTLDTFDLKTGKPVPANHDDFAVMSQHGLKLRTDEAGQTRRTAKSFGLTRATQQTYGYITTRSDQDWYKFTWNCDSNLQADAEPASYNPNLDVKLTLYNGYGKAITSANPPTRKVDAATATGLNAKLNVKLAKGSTYYLAIDGVGYKTPSTGGYSDYGSRGDYALKANGCADNVPLPAPKISAPTQEQTIYGTLAIRGTGVPGAKVDVVANGPTGSSRSAQAGLPYSVQPNQPVSPLPDEPKSSLRLRQPQHPTAIGDAVPVGRAVSAPATPRSGVATSDSTPTGSATSSPHAAGAPADGHLMTVCRGVTVGADGTWSCVPNPKLGPGTYAIAVTQTRGDRTSDPALRSFTIAAATPSPTPTAPPTTVTPTPTAPPSTTVTPTMPTVTVSSTPPEIATVPPSQTDPNLANTGSSGADVIAIVAGVLLTGAGAVTISRRRPRRRH